MSTDNSGAAVGGGEIMLFGVRVRVDPMRKSVSLNDLSQYELPPPESSSAAADPSSAAAAGYVSADDAVRPQSSGGSRERKRGVPWTEEEHKLFLLGLQTVGKGDWRGISRKFVKTRTPTQVASHAQKYFLRRSNLNRRRRRSSLFDMTAESVTPIPMEENVQPKHEAQPLIPPTQLPPPETSILTDPQLFQFPVTMCPMSVPVQADIPIEKLTFGHEGHINHRDSVDIVHANPVLPVPARTPIVDLNLNQGLLEDPSPLSLNLSLSLDKVQDQFSRQPSFEAMSCFNNGDSMISVA